MKGSRQGIIFLLVAVIFFSTATAGAHAATVEYLAGGGDVDADIYVATYYHARVNIVLPLSKRMDAFGGLEYIDSGAAEEYYQSGTHGTYSLYIPGAGFGLRVKPFMGKRFQFYLQLGGLAGKVHYKARFDDLEVTLLSNQRGSSYFVSPRFGWGISFKFNEKVSAVFETSAIGPPPAFNVVVANNQTGVIEDRKLNESGYMFGALIGLKYLY